ncbi:MAG TPA: Ig-like domain-containing protein [Gemmatimonadaceae bacterium]|nr:Ig-like domain-containing protein [Gemmatimonadaceae bacterium]
MRLNRLSSIAFAAAVLASCSGDGGSGPNGEVITVVVTPANPQVQVGFAIQLSAVVNGPPGIPQAVVWEARNAEIADVNESGLVGGLAEGEGVIRVKWATDVREFTDVAVIVTTTPVGEGRPAVKVIAR